MEFAEILSDQKAESLEAAIVNDALLLSDSLVPDQASVAKLLTDGGKMMADLRIKKHDHHKK